MDTMKAGYLLAALGMVCNEGMRRVVESAGISQSDMDKFMAHVAWMPEQTLAMRRVLDTLVFAAVETAGFPRTDVSAVVPAVVIACMVSPVNWYRAASFGCGFLSPQDVQDKEDLVEIERVQPFKMMHYIIHADAATKEGTSYELRSRLAAFYARRSEVAL